MRSVATVTLLAVVLAVCVPSAVSDCQAISRGWGDSINWSTFDAGLQKAAAENKLMLLIIHKTWCGTCS